MQETLNFIVDNWEPLSLIITVAVTLAGGPPLKAWLTARRAIGELVALADESPENNGHIVYRAARSDRDEAFKHLNKRLVHNRHVHATPGVVRQATLKPRLLIAEARRWVGVSERGGDNSGQLIEMFQRAVDGKASGEPWCAAFVRFCINAVDGASEAVESSEGSLLFRTEHVLTLWEKSPLTHRLTTPEPGCLMLWRRFENGEPTRRGHVAIVAAVEGSALQTIEGNVPSLESDAVLQLSRASNTPGSDSMRHLGYLRVWNA